MEYLPYEIIERILRCLPIDDQISLESVCSTWMQILRSFWSSRKGIAIDKWRHVTFYNDRSTVRDRFLISKSSRAESIVRFVVRRYGKAIKLFRLESCRIGVDFLLKLADQCPNLTTLILARNRVIFQAPTIDFVESLRPLVCSGKLETLSLLSNEGLNYRDWSFSRHPPFVPPTIHLFVDELNHLPATLTNLNLNNVCVSAFAFARLCRRLAPSLKRLRLGQDSCNILKDSLAVGLAALTGLTDLNLAGRNYSACSLTAYLDDVSLEWIGKSITGLESLSLSFAHQITDVGVISLLTSPAGRSTLTRLKLDHCSKVSGSSIVAGLRSRKPTAAPLTIYARSTLVDHSHAFRVNSSKVTVVVDNEKPDDYTFFGDEL